jgi:hypothetical protein
MNKPKYNISLQTELKRSVDENIIKNVTENKPNSINYFN